MYSFSDDILSIFNTNDDPNLEQGKDFINREKKNEELVIPHLHILDTIYLDLNLESVSESMSREDSTENVENKVVMENIREEEDIFNQTLSEYSKTYELLMKEMMEKNQTRKNSPLFGKVVSKDGNYTYVNDYGYTHKYSTASWESKNKNCPDSAIPDENYLEMLNAGPDMEIGQPCEVAGKNIQNIETGETAWVDIQGYKHVYSSDVWKNKNKKCNIIPIELSNEDYNKIPQGNAMMSTSECDNLDINPKLWKKLVMLNQKLLRLVEEISQNVHFLQYKDTRMQSEINKKQKVINNYKNFLEKQKNSIDNKQIDYATIESEMEDSGLVLESNKLKYLLWILMVVFIIGITIHSIFNEPSNLTTTVVLILALVVLYNIIIYFT
jgi:hypothetical protein